MESKRPLLSIVIANYNYGRFLEDSILSVVSQEGFNRCELIVVDGGSSDNSVDIIRKYADRISWWISENDRGQSDAFNKGFAHARGRFFTWLNADDVFVKGSLMAFINAVKRYPECRWFAGSCAYIGADGRFVKGFQTHRFSVLRARFVTVSVGGPSSFFAADLFDQVGGFDVDLHYTMDTDLWYKFYLIGHVRFRRMKELIFAFRIHADSKTSAAIISADEKAKQNHLRALKECDLMANRYQRGKLGGLGQKVIMALTFSPFDKIVSMIRTLRLRGSLAYGG